MTDDLLDALTFCTLGKKEDSSIAVPSVVGTNNAFD
jgi:hypothetical protein